MDWQNITPNYFIIFLILSWYLTHYLRHREYLKLLKKYKEYR